MQLAKSLNSPTEVALNDFAKLAMRLGAELEYCHAALLETQNYTSEIIAQETQKDSIVGFQQLDYATQCVRSIGHILEAMSKAAFDQEPLRLDVEIEKHVLEEIRRRVWGDEDFQDHTRESSAGVVDWF